MFRARSSAVGEALGIGFSLWSPLGTAFLTGAIAPTTVFEATDARVSHGLPRFTPHKRSARTPLWKCRATSGAGTGPSTVKLSAF